TPAPIPGGLRCADPPYGYGYGGLLRFPSSVPSRGLRPLWMQPEPAESRTAARRPCGSDLGRWGIPGQADNQMGASAGRGVDVDPTPVLLDDPVADRQAQPRPLTDRLGREE